MKKLVALFIFFGWMGMVLAQVPTTPGTDGNENGNQGENPVPPQAPQEEIEIESPKPDKPKPEISIPIPPVPPVPNPNPVPSPNPIPQPPVPSTPPVPPSPPSPPSPPAPESPQEGGTEDGLRTQTQGGWGSSPNGNNPGKYLHDHFDRAFPSGVTIGNGFTLKFTSAQAITDFLPSGGKPQALKKSEVNPSRLGNNLAAQTLALTISVGMDRHLNGGRLANLRITKGTLSGTSVRDLLTMANQALGGRASSFTVSELNDALTKCNESFVDGKRNTGFLSSGTVSTSTTSGTTISSPVRPSHKPGKGKKDKDKKKDKEKEKKGKDKAKDKQKGKGHSKEKGKNK